MSVKNGKSSIFAMTVDVLVVGDLNTFLSGGTVHSESVQLSITVGNV